ncbi:alpha/beta hydrolase [Streptomyces termitum]|uniref:Alpha/beta hydrolase n=1 Tax=Streptomyces termitum TaxID=67368 RepID=A0A918W4E5_9ACTN|nr:alpha/beta hydrolase [Streptomyces termitum]GHA67149.1 alpha/beta hydrolase [Streptomyces termitum]
MAQYALVGTADGRRPRLGRPVGVSRSATAVGGVVLLLPDGEPVSGRRASARAHAAALPMARALARAGRADGLLAQVVRYRGRGWNGADAELAADASWAIAEAVRRHGDVPVCLVGHGMGARAALRAAGHPAVGAVMALAPWLPEDDVAAEPEPVRQLTGRRVLIVHGTDDAATDPELSFRYAVRAKKANRETCRFEVHTDGHALRQYASEVRALAADFALGALFGRPVARPLTDAMAAPPPIGLRMPLAAGFGGSRRR